MTHGKKNLRIMLTGVVVAFAVAAPAQASSLPADVHVCNQATPTALGGTFVSDGDDSKAARFQEQLLKSLPGQGAGLAIAADKSGALSLCRLPGGSGGETEYAAES